MQMDLPKHLWCITRWSRLALTLEGPPLRAHACEASNEGWAAAFKLVLLPKDQRRPSDQHDFGAELRLRGLRSHTISCRTR